MTPDPRPATRHGRYVLDIARGWHWAAFDVNDITQIEDEAAAAERARILAALPEALRHPLTHSTVIPAEVVYDGTRDEFAADLAAAIEKLVG